MTTGLKLLSAENIIELASMASCKIAEIKQSDDFCDIINCGKFHYKVLKQNEIDEAVLNWFKKIGSGEYFLTCFFRDKAEEIIDSLGVNIIKNTQQFLSDARDEFNNDYKSEFYKYHATFGDYLKDVYGLEISDIFDAQKVWDSDILYTGLSSYFRDEMLPYIQKYGINDEAIYKKIYELYLTDTQILGDYGVKFSVGDLVFYQRDV